MAGFRNQDPFSNNLLLWQFQGVLLCKIGNKEYKTKYFTAF